MEKYKPRFCVHIAKFVMCRQPHQKSGCKQPRTSSYTTPSTECFAGENPLSVRRAISLLVQLSQLVHFPVVTYRRH